MWSYNIDRQELAELRYMRDVAEAQRQEILALQEECEVLSARLREAEVTESQIRDMLTEEGLIPQTYAPDAGVASATDRSRVTLLSRDGDRHGRLSAARDLGSALETVADITQNLDKRLDLVDAGVSDLLEKASRLVAISRARPNRWPTSGIITSDFGSRRHPITGGSDTHEGVDIAASYGQGIVAPADGVVTFSGYKSGYGYCIIINHSFGFETLYAHCSRLSVSSGQEVQRGQRIADVGQSGTATGPHLHYEVHVEGQKVDPRDFLP
ncbi:MAG: M23 family metallopeptidase [Bacillota bacterium]